MPKRREFLSLLECHAPADLEFTRHFLTRDAQRNVGKGRIEDILFNQKDNLLFVDEDVSNVGLKRYRAYYKFAHRKYLLIVVDVTRKDKLEVVTSVVAEIKNLRRG